MALTLRTRLTGISIPWTLLSALLMFGALDIAAVSINGFAVEPDTLMAGMLGVGLAVGALLATMGARRPIVRELVIASFAIAGFWSWALFDGPGWAGVREGSLWLLWFEGLASIGLGALIGTLAGNKNRHRLPAGHWLIWTAITMFSFFGSTVAIVTLRYVGGDGLIDAGNTSYLLRLMAAASFAAPLVCQWLAPAHIIGSSKLGVALTWLVAGGYGAITGAETNIAEFIVGITLLGLLAAFVAGMGARLGWRLSGRQGQEDQELVTAEVPQARASMTGDAAE